MMFNTRALWNHLSGSHCLQSICSICIALMVQIAIAQEILQHTEPADSFNPKGLTRFSNSVAGERIASFTCDPFMSLAEEHTLMRLLYEQDDAPWIDFSLRKLKDHLSNACNLVLEEKSIEEENVSLEDILMKEVPTGTLGARLSAVLRPHSLTYTIRQNRLEIGSQSAVTETTRIYDVTPLVRSLKTRAAPTDYSLVTPLLDLIQATISPNDWVSSGGSCTIHVFHPPSTMDRVCLVVRSFTENHLCIQRLLDQLNLVGMPPPSKAGKEQFNSKINPPSSFSLPEWKRWQADRLDPNQF